MSQGHGTETVEAVYNYQPMKGVEAYFRGVLHSKTPVVVVGWQVSWPYNLLVVYRNKSVNL